MGQTDTSGEPVLKDGLNASLGWSLSTEYRGIWAGRVRDLKSVELKEIKSSLNVATAAAVQNTKKFPSVFFYLFSYF